MPIVISKSRFSISQTLAKQNITSLGDSKPPPPYLFLHHNQKEYFTFIFF